MSKEVSGSKRRARDFCQPHHIPFCMGLRFPLNVSALTRIAQGEAYWKAALLQLKHQNELGFRANAGTDFRPRLGRKLPAGDSKNRCERYLSPTASRLSVHRETGLGKSTLARWLAQSLFCTGAEGDPCGTCRDCQAMRGGNHPDFLQIVPTDSQGQTNRLNGLLRVEQAEDIQHHAMLRPFQSKHRVILIRDLQLAHESFLNKLLKTFEEPPPAVVLLGTVTHASRLLPTLVSRCQLLPTQTRTPV